MGRIEYWGDTADSRRLAIVAVHGRGQGVQFMREVAERLAIDDVGYFAPSVDGDSWYPHPFLDSSPENEAHLILALEAVEGAIALARERGYRRVALLGFSQGACVLAHMLLTRRVSVDGAVLFTGGYVGPDEIGPLSVEPRAHVPVLLRSVQQDPWVPPHRVADTAALLVHAGLHVDVLIEPGDTHIITERGIRDGRSALESWRDSVV